MQRLSVAMQNYLETVFDLARQADTARPDNSSPCHSGVRVSDIAAHLNVSKASVNNAINVLAKLGFVSSEKYQEIYLTDLGRETAAVLESRHSSLKALFTESLGVAPTAANEDACAIEHIVSPETVQRMHEYLVRQGINVVEK